MLRKVIEVRLIAAAMIAFLTACAGPVYEGRYEYDRGWRIAKVLAIGDEISFGSKWKGIEDCRSEVSANSATSVDLALVQYHWGRGTRMRLALIASGQPVSALSTVYVNTYDCRQPIIAVTAPSLAGSGLGGIF